MDRSEAHSDTFAFQSAIFGRFEMLNKTELFLSQRMDFSEAHSDAFVFQSAIFGRLELLNKIELFCRSKDGLVAYGCM